MTGIATYDRDPSTLSLDERFTALLDAERAITRIQARQARVLAAIVDDPREGQPAPVVEKQYVRDELRAALGESAVRVSGRIDTARALVHRLPATLAGLEGGELTMRHAHLLADAVALLDDGNAAVVERRCVPFAAKRDLTAFARKVRREVLALDNRSIEDQLADAIAKAVAERRVWVRPDQYSAALAHLGAVLPAEGAQALMMALDVAADRREADDTRTKDQRRSDALVQLGIDALNRFQECPHCRGQRIAPRSGPEPIVVPDDNAQKDHRGADLPRLRGLRPSIQVSVALSTLLGIDNQPGDLDGHGPIPAELARRLATDPTGTWRRLVTDPVGRLVDYGRTVYEPPIALRDFVIARDRTCRFPSCTRAACRCEVDHVVAWAEGGETNESNLHGLCCRHHHLKHDTDWTVERRPDGTTVWTSPSGDTYAVDPATYPIDHTSVVRNNKDSDDSSADEQAA